MIDDGTFSQAGSLSRRRFKAARSLNVLPVRGLFRSRLRWWPKFKVAAAAPEFDVAYWEAKFAA